MRSEGVDKYYEGSYSHTTECQGEAEEEVGDSSISI